VSHSQPTANDTLKNTFDENSLQHMWTSSGPPSDLSFQSKVLGILNFPNTVQLMNTTVWWCDCKAKTTE